MTFCGLVGTKTSARIGEGLRIPKENRLMLTLVAFLYSFTTSKHSSKRHQNSDISSPPVRCFNLSRSLSSKSNVTVKLSFKLVLKLVHFTNSFLVS